MLEINEFKIPVCKVGGEKAVFLKLFSAACRKDYTGNNPLGRKGISNTNIRNVGQKIMVTPDGALEFLACLTKLSTKCKQAVIDEMHKKGFIKEKVFATAATAEANFGKELRDFCLELNLRIDEQFRSTSEYSAIYDFKIANLIVEFDEDGHSSYDKNKEIERGQVVISEGMGFLRVKESESLAVNLGKITKKLIEMGCM